MVSVKPDMTDSCPGNDLQHTIKKPIAGSQNRDHYRVFNKFRRFSFNQRGRDGRLGKRQLARHLISKQQTGFSEQLAKALARGIKPTHLGQLMLNKGMVYDMKFWHTCTVGHVDRKKCSRNMGTLAREWELALRSP